jgi:hypothetical protein
MPLSALWHSVGLVRTDVWEESITSIIRVKRISGLGKTLAVTTTWKAVKALYRIQLWLRRKVLCCYHVGTKNVVYRLFTTFSARVKRFYGHFLILISYQKFRMHLQHYALSSY